MQWNSVVLPSVEIKIDGIGAPKIPQSKHVDICTWNKSYNNKNNS